MLTKEEVLAPLARLRGDAVVVTTMGMVRPWARCSAGPLDLASADSAMGHAADLAVGIAMAQPRRKVVCLNGDGSLLMCLGTLVTAVAAGVPNLVHVVVENGGYEITGNQPLPGVGVTDLAAMARAAGWPRVERFTAAAPYAAALPEILAAPGPWLVALAVEPGSEGPIRRGPHEAAAYLKTSLAEAAHRLRRVLAAASPGGDGG